MSKTQPKLFLLLALIMLGDITVTSRTIGERKAISYAKKLDVAKIDPSLPKQPFEKWLQNVLAPGVKIKWEMNDCGEQNGAKADKQRDLPTCVGIDAQLIDGREVILAIFIGTIKKGLTNEIGVYYCTIKQGNQSTSVRSLSDLSKMISKK